VPRLIDRHRKDRVLAVAVAVMAVGFAMLSLTDRLAGYLAAAAVWTVGSMLAAPPNAEINSELAPVELRGRYQAVFFLTFPAAAFLAPALGGVSLQSFGSAHWLIVAAIGVIAAGLHLAAGPSRERRVSGAEMKAPAAAGDTHPHRRRPH
jgi:MFS family permease